MLRRLAVIVLALAIVGGGVAIAYTYLRPVVVGFFEPNDYPGPGSGSVRVTVAQGAGGSAIATVLADQDVVKTTKAFIEAASDDPKSAGIQPGVYEMRTQMKATDALAILVDPANRIVTKVVVPEGKWAKEVYPILSNATGIPVAEYAKAAKDAAGLGLPASAKGNVEGYLFPASYEFEPDTTAVDHLRTMVAESTKRLEALGVTPDQMERTMIVASLVEAEARFAEDRPKVARVVENRLAQDMQLQFDSTVNYATGKHGITTTDARPGQQEPLQHVPSDGTAARADREPGRERDPGGGPAGSGSVALLRHGRLRPRGRPSSPSPTRSTRRTSPSSRSGARRTRASAERGGRGVKCAVWGSPIAHSLSPVLHRAAYAALGLHDWTYEAREVDEAGFDAALVGLDDQWRGLSLTMPLKEVALGAASASRPPQRTPGRQHPRAGSEGWTAHNTDVNGIARRAARRGLPGHRPTR